MEIVNLPNFGYIYKSAIEFDSLNNFFFGEVVDINYDVILFNSNYRYFKEAWSSQFCRHYQNCNNVDLNSLNRLDKNEKY